MRPLVYSVPVGSKNGEKVEFLEEMLRALAPEIYLQIERAHRALILRQMNVKKPRSIMQGSTVQPF